MSLETAKPLVFKFRNEANQTTAYLVLLELDFFPLKKTNLWLYSALAPPLHPKLSRHFSMLQIPKAAN